MSRRATRKLYEAVSAAWQGGLSAGITRQTYRVIYLDTDACQIAYDDGWKTGAAMREQAQVEDRGGVAGPSRIPVETWSLCLAAAQRPT